MLSLDELSKKLKRIRIDELDYSQNETCLKSGLNQPTLSNIENGKNYKMESFLILYNFYCKELDSNKVISILFEVKDAYTEILIEKLNLLSEKTVQEIDKIKSSL